MSTAETRTLRLVGDLGVERLAGIWREAIARGSGLQEIDLSAVGQIDSAGVALLLALGEEIRRRHGRAPELRNLPQRYHALCRAHRIENGNGNGHA